MMDTTVIGDIIRGRTRGKPTEKTDRGQDKSPASLVAAHTDGTSGYDVRRYEVDTWGQGITVNSSVEDKGRERTLKQQEDRIMQHNKKTFPMKYTAAHTPERQTAGTRTSETTLIRPITNGTVGSPRMVTGTGSRYLHSCDRH